jgi:hypothetical protein
MFGFASQIVANKASTTTLSQSVGVLYVTELWTERVRAKSLNLRNLVGDGTPLATPINEAREMAVYFTARARRPDEVHP